MMIRPKFILLLWILYKCVYGQSYPPCWVQNGECLDSNEGPLTKGIKPLINRNIIGNATFGISKLDDCMNLCLKEPLCKYFTWYPTHGHQMNESECLLVGFNLRQACFNLNNVCVLQKECEKFDTTCSSCQTGLRPFIDPNTEPLTVLITGMTDNRLYRQQQTRQYTLSMANQNELFVNLDVNKTCLFRNTYLTQRMGATVGYIKGQLILCGGYTFDDKTSDDSSMAAGDYMNNCESFKDRNSGWANHTNLNYKRAFASGIVLPNKNNSETFYILGGYDRDVGFLDSVESYTPGGSGWVNEVNMKLSSPLSHFCTVFSTDISGVRAIYKIGGWTIQYMNTFEMYKFNDSAAVNVQSSSISNWTKLVDMPNARADHACAVVQFRWSVGIMVAGGYGDGAWLQSVDFFDFDKVAWVNMVPFLTQGRHYHGLTTFGLIPMVFGGWNNGSLSSYEMLDFCKDPPVWVSADNFLQVKREKFAYTRVPQSYVYNCD